MKKLFGVIFSTIILLLVFWFILGYFNFQNITNKKNKHPPQRPERREP